MAEPNQTPPPQAMSDSQSASATPEPPPVPPTAQEPPAAPQEPPETAIVRALPRTDSTGSTAEQDVVYELGPTGYDITNRGSVRSDTIHRESSEAKASVTTQQKPSKWRRILGNWLLSSIVFFTGIFGIVLARCIKSNWSGLRWAYFPFFWIPVVGTWPVSLAIFLGYLDRDRDKDKD